MLVHGSDPDKTTVNVEPLCLMDAIEPTEYSYFAPAVLASWAGPIHWKINSKHVIRKGKFTNCATYTFKNIMEGIM